ncbi:hypothetical protein CH373_14360 [Leptospira perolatii]|uniref:DinB family protein n=1 Tax=Leptospira perolatii TaxID=2023191 RepID=A0A2M9ZJX4_9LEPT|nr:hypothetical protein [Leptospira perolatii]PJZ69278.1 hypothetical protein CH360_12260 [Leptospira perolatii]PJZ72340.1 hypothetical protein CH373_14360 [Leptospira perolatii]
MQINESNLAKSLSSLLLQLGDIVRGISPQDYSAGLSILSGSSVGKHVRHSIEIAEALINGRHTGVISYDRRKRNPVYEVSNASASERLYELASYLEIATWAGEAKVCYFSGPDSQNEEITDTHWERELLYVQDHTIHHNAMIRVALESELKMKAVPKSFGIAFSTLNYENSQTNSSESIHIK